MTADIFVNAGIPIKDNATALLYAESALDWLKENTTLEINQSDLTNLPAGAKLFVTKYGEIMSKNAMVTSESIGPMSQSFNSSDKSGTIYDLAYSLLGQYMKSQVTFTAAQKRWK